MKIKHKAFAYITSKERILVFEHVDFPEAGIQVPAGTRGKNEDPVDAVAREAREETGIEKLSIASFLGEIDFEIVEREETHRRRFYHLVCEDPVQDSWIHFEADPSEGSKHPIRFRLYWIDLTKPVTGLALGHDAFTNKLRDRMKIRLNKALTAFTGLSPRRAARAVEPGRFTNIPASLARASSLQSSAKLVSAELYRNRGQISRIDSG